MKSFAVIVAVLLASPAAMAWDDAQPICTRVAYVNQTSDYLVLNGEIRIRKSRENSDYLSAALVNPRLVVCTGTETDLWGNVDIARIGPADSFEIR